MRKIEIDDEVFAFLASKARPFVDKTENDVLRNLLLADLAIAHPKASPRPAQRKVVVRRTSQPKLVDLVEAGIVEPGQSVRHHQARKGLTVRATITDRGLLRTDDGTSHSSVSGALVHFVDSQINGWAQWTHETSGKTLAELRDAYMRLPLEPSGPADTTE